MLVEEVYLKHRPISYQYTAIDWVAVSTEVFFAIIWKRNRQQFFFLHFYSQRKRITRGRLQLIADSLLEKQKHLNIDSILLKKKKKNNFCLTVCIIRATSNLTTVLMMT